MSEALLNFFVEAARDRAQFWSVGCRQTREGEGKRKSHMHLLSVSVNKNLALADASVTINGALTMLGLFEGPNNKSLLFLSSATASQRTQVDAANAVVR